LIQGILYSHFLLLLFYETAYNAEISEAVFS